MYTWMRIWVGGSKGMWEVNVGIMQLWVRSVAWMGFVPNIEQMKVVRRILYCPRWCRKNNEAKGCHYLRKKQVDK